jgi:hypothetical protein
MSPSKRLAGLGLVMTAALALVSRPALGENARAILLGGFRDDCTIIRAGGESVKAKAMMALFSGDRIVQRSGVDEIVIKCSPFTSLKKLDGTTITILWQPPAEKKTILKELQSFLGFEKDQHQRRTAGTRTVKGPGGDGYVPQPGFWATILPGEAVEFSWDRRGATRIVFRDPAGVEVFSKVLGEKASIALTSQDIPMRPGEIYRWEVEVPGVPRGRETYALKLLESDTAKLIDSELKELAEEMIGETERKLRIAAYCQFVSDTYPQDVDLYWKSFQVLNGLDTTGMTAEEKDTAHALRDRCLQHIEEQMATGYR